MHRDEKQGEHIPWYRIWTLDGRIIILLFIFDKFGCQERRPVPTLHPRGEAVRSGARIAQKHDMHAGMRYDRRVLASLGSFSPDVIRRAGAQADNRSSFRPCVYKTSTVL